MLTVQQVWSIGIAKSIRSSGAGLEVACHVASFLEGLTAKQLETAFADGQTCIIVYRVDGRVDFLPRLMRASEATTNPMLRKVQEQAAAAGHVFQWTGLDVKPMLDQIVAKVEVPKKQTARRGATRRRS